MEKASDTRIIGDEEGHKWPPAAVLAVKVQDELGLHLW